MKKSAIPTRNKMPPINPPTTAKKPPNIPNPLATRPGASPAPFIVAKIDITTFPATKLLMPPSTSRIATTTTPVGLSFPSFLSF